MARVDYRAADLVDTFTFHRAASLWLDPTPDEYVDEIRDWLWDEGFKLLWTKFQSNCTIRVAVTPPRAFFMGKGEFLEAIANAPNLPPDDRNNWRIPKSALKEIARKHDSFPPFLFPEKRKDRGMSNTEKETFQKTIGVLVYECVENAGSPKFGTCQKPNFNALAERISDKVEQLESQSLFSPRGLSQRTLRRLFSEGYETLKL